MRIAIIIMALLGLSAAGVRAAGPQTMVVDDFASSTAAKAWYARPTARISYEKGALRLELSKWKAGQDKWPGMTRDAAKLPIADYNGLMIELENPTEQTQSLQVSFSGDSGSTQLLKSVGPKFNGTIKVYFDRMTSGTVDWSNIQSITFSHTTPSTPETWLIKRISLFCDNPATTEMGKLRAFLTSAQAAFHHARTDGALTQKQQTEGQATLARSAELLQSPQSIRGKADECRNALTSLQSLSLSASVHKETGKPVVLWQTPVGTRFEPLSAMAQYQQPLQTLKMYSARGEYQNGIVRVTNLSDATQEWQLALDSKDPAVAAAMNVRRNQAVLASDHSVVGDALTPLDGAGVVSVAPGETAELWITADVKHHTWSAGVHQAELILKDLRRGDTSIVKLPIEVTIRNFNVNDAPPMHLNMWSFLYYLHAKPIEGREEAALQNLRDYGCDVFVLNAWQLPWPTLDADGNPTAPMDFTLFDKLVKFYRSRGHVTLLVMLGLNASKPDWLALRSGLKPYSPQWQKGMRYWIEQFAQRMRELGVPTSDYAYYINDEPDWGELDMTRAVTRIIKSVDPSQRIYMDTSELYDDPKLNDELLKEVSINQVNGDSMAARPNLLPRLQKHSNVELWVYQCRLHTRSRQAVNVYDYYRLLAWQAQHDGMNGTGYWLYLYDDAKDLWDGTTGGGASVIYPDADKGLLMSVRWELIRTGLDDVKYYRLLEKMPRTPTVADLLGRRFDEVLAHPDDPQLAVQWRIDAGAAIDAGHH